MITITAGQLKVIQVIAITLSIFGGSCYILWRIFRNKIIEFTSRGNFLRAVILKKNKQFVIVSNVIKINRFEWKGKAYTIDEDANIYVGKTAYAFYYENNPSPIKFKDNKTEIDTKTLKQMLETKVLQDLFRNPNEFTMLLIMIIVNIAITGIGIYILYRKIK